MRILWVSASAIGPASRILEQKYGGSSGVWIQTIYEELKEKNDNAEMFFLCFSKNVKKNTVIHKKNAEGEAFCLNMPRVSLGRNAPEHLKKNIERIIDDIKPDIIHIWGTETCVQNVVADCAENIPKIVFIQGIIGVHDRYHNSDLKKQGLIYKKSFFEKARGFVYDYLFHKQVKFEAQEIKNCGNVIIDNKFTAAYCKSIDENIRFYNYHLNPSKVFEENIWSFDGCVKNSIFTIYGSSQDKGLHQLLRAVSIVKKSVPDVKVIIPGAFHIDPATNRLSKTGLSSYEKFLLKLIKEGSIEENVVFCGQLTQKEMAEHIKESNIFVNPSVMEVHAGSLREAMLVGIPSISTYCGSVGEYLLEGKNGLLYRYEEFEVLAFKILELFNNSELCSALGENARKTIINSKCSSENTLFDIYNCIAK